MVANSDKKDALLEMTSGFPNKSECDIWGSHGGDYEDYNLLGCDIV
jgi:hypothetical protein